jgi:outer membrane protein
MPFDIPLWHFRTTLLIVLSSFVVAPAWAEDETSSSYKWRLGIGVGAAQRPYRGADPSTLAVPLIFADGRYFSLFGTGGDIKLATTGPIDWRVRGRFEFSEGYEANDASELRGMKDRKASAWVGPAAIVHTSLGDVSIEYLTDASGHSRGERGLVGMRRRFSSGAWSVTPRAEVGWMSADVVDYYFGVKSSEATLARRAYEGHSTTVLRTGIRVDYQLGGRSTLFVDAGASRFGAAVEHSPLVSRRVTGSLFAGYLRTF